MEHSLAQLKGKKSFSFRNSEYTGKIAIETSYAARGTQCMQCNTKNLAKNSFAIYTHLWDIIFWFSDAKLNRRLVFGPNEVKYLSINRLYIDLNEHGSNIWSIINIIHQLTLNRHKRTANFLHNEWHLKEPQSQQQQQQQQQHQTMFCKIDLSAKVKHFEHMKRNAIVRFNESMEHTTCTYPLNAHVPEKKRTYGLDMSKRYKWC